MADEPLQKVPDIFWCQHNGFDIETLYSYAGAHYIVRRDGRVIGYAKDPKQAEGLCEASRLKAEIAQIRWRAVS